MYHNYSRCRRFRKLFFPRCTTIPRSSKIISKHISNIYQKSSKTYLRFTKIPRSSNNIQDFKDLLRFQEADFSKSLSPKLIAPPFSKIHLCLLLASTPTPFQIFQIVDLYFPMFPHVHFMFSGRY